ncbi:MAG: alpha/beta hydrolase [Chloroflexota bacterium]
MRSFKSRLMNLLLRSLGAKKMFVNFADAQADPEAFLKAVTDARAGGDYLHEPPEKITSQTKCEQLDVNGNALHLLEFGSKKRVIFFLHGGAYVLGVARPYWDMVKKIGEGADCHLALFDYPLAPEHTCESVLESCMAAFDLLIERYGVENVVVMGDSAGGGLSMGLTLKLRDLERPLPNKIALLYPWLDVTMSHPEARGIESSDYLLGVDGLIACGKHYAGDLGVEHPYVSPWFADLAGLPPIGVFTGTWDVLHSEGRDFVGKVKATGGSVELNVYEQMQHAWLLFDMPETRKGLDDIRKFLS